MPLSQLMGNSIYQFECARGMVKKGHLPIFKPKVVDEHHAQLLRQLIFFTYDRYYHANYESGRNFRIQRKELIEIDRNGLLRDTR